MTKKNTYLLIGLMILTPIIGYLFNIFAIFLFLPLALFLKNRKN